MKKEFIPTETGAHVLLTLLIHKGAPYSLLKYFVKEFGTIAHPLILIGQLNKRRDISSLSWLADNGFIAYKPSKLVNSDFFLKDIDGIVTLSWKGLDVLTLSVNGLKRHEITDENFPCKRLSNYMIYDTTNDVS